MHLNESALRLARELINHAARARVIVTRMACGTHIIDCGVGAEGGLKTGCCLAEICLAGLATVRLETGDRNIWPGPWVSVFTDDPLSACMASQYAGWPVSHDGYFAMGSGPMRAARGHEDLFEKIQRTEKPQQVVGVLESGELPGEDVCVEIARQTGVVPTELTLLVARTASLAGAVQIVARTVETTLHKLLELGFDLERVVSGFGTAPLPPVAGDDLAGIGRTNDAVLYGGSVTLWVRGDDASLQELGPRIPSGASADHGRPFAEIFADYDHDFYRIDPLLFSPSEVQLVNLDSGQSYRFGEPDPQVLRRSFVSP